MNRKIKTTCTILFLWCLSACFYAVFSIFIQKSVLAAPIGHVQFSQEMDESTEIDDQRSIENLRAFAKLYGYVRYFHPSDEASAIDWERFAVYGAEKVKHAENRYSGFPAF